MKIWVLVIDDHESERRSVAKLLNDAGYSVMMAGSGGEGLRLCQETEPEIVLLDVAMPVRESIDTLIELRRSRAELKILATTGFRHSGSVGVGDMLRRLGADDVLRTPCEPEVLLAKVDRLVSLPVAQTAA